MNSTAMSLVEIVQINHYSEQYSKSLQWTIQQCHWWKLYKGTEIPKGWSETSLQRKAHWPKERGEIDKFINDLQNTTQKTNDWVTRTPHKNKDEHVYSGKGNSSCTFYKTNGNKDESNIVFAQIS